MGRIEESSVSVTCLVSQEDVELLQEIASKLADPAFRTELVEIVNDRKQLSSDRPDGWRIFAPF